MKSVILTLIVSFLSAWSVQADTLKNDNLAVSVNNKMAISYGFSSLEFSDEAPLPIKINHPVRPESGVSLSLVGTAEAYAPSFNPQDFKSLCKTIDQAEKLNDLRPVLSESFYQHFQSKVDAGAQPYAVLSMFKELRPTNIEVTDFLVEESHAQLAVVGQSYLGPMQGVVGLVQNEGTWIIENERWYTDTKQSKLKAPIAATVNLAAPRYQVVSLSNHPGLLRSITPDYGFNKNPLGLVKIKTTRNKRAFSFVFVMNKKKVDRAHATEVEPRRPNIHILAPRIVKRQKSFHTRYPTDVSVARYDDGFAKDEWNIVLPTKKPREVTVSLLWSF